MASAGLLALGAVPALASPSPTKSWSGRTSQHGLVTLLTGTTSARLGSRPEIKRLTIAWDARCAGYAQPFRLTTYHVQIPLTGGAWNTYGTYTKTGQGYTNRITVRDRGTITAKKITGTFSGTVRIARASDHHYMTTCRSGRVRFTLRPARTQK